jgi:dipeptidyl aminopeptidase/acylaminoacyl peptidase
LSWHRSEWAGSAQRKWNAGDVPNVPQSLVKREHNLVSWAISCLAVWLISTVAIGIFVAESALHIPRKPLGPADKALAQEISAHYLATMNDVAIRAQDGSVLRAWTFIPQGGNGNAVILLHGQGDNRAGMLGNADLFLQHGYSVLLPDARAHGESDGQIVTYGVKERSDLVRWYDWLEQSESPHCIYGLGESMGAAILLQTIAKEPGFCAVVAESSFSNFREAAYIRMGEGLRAGPWLGRTLLRPAVEAGLIYARLKYGVDLTAASPIKAVASSRVPIFLIHGLADTNIPPYNSERMKAANSAVQLWEPEGAGHCGASAAAPEEYERLVTSWFGSHR